MRAPDPVSTARLRALAPLPARPIAPAEPDPAEPDPAEPDLAEPEPAELEPADPGDLPEQVSADEGPLSWAPPATLPAHLRAALRARLPAPLRGGRWDPGRRGVVLVGVLGLAAVLVAVGLALHGRAHAVTPATAAAPAAGPDLLTAAPPVLVDVEGRVSRPGLVRLAAGSRVADAIAAAGGALPGTDTSGLDLAQKVTDGQQLRVGAPAVAPAAATGPAATGAGAPAATGGLVDLNTASVDQLDALPRIGPATAQKIIDWRTQHGSFSSVDQLKQIAGIGPATYQQLAPLVTV